MITWWAEQAPTLSLSHSHLPPPPSCLTQVNKDAAFYLCGPAGNMPVQMKNAVVDAIATVGKMPHEQADATVTDWQIKGKYNVEVW